MTSLSIIEQILDLGRWAPSGDNTQPWRFEIIDPFNVVVHGFDTRQHCVYDLDGHPSQISIGALIETISVAASMFGWLMNCRRRAGLPDTTPTFDLRFSPVEGTAPDRLASSIKRRSVQRRSMNLRALTPQEKHSLESSMGPDYGVLWLEGFDKRFKAARLMFGNAKLRLTMPEAYQVHRDVIEWNSKYSEERVPDQALGVDAMTSRLMRFVMHSWKRVEFFNRFLAGTWAPRIQMDFMPSLACAAHFVIRAQTEPSTIDDYVAGGRALQRFWLTVTDLGLVMQPEMTPIIFSRYVRVDLRFSKILGMQERARLLAARLSLLVGDEALVRGVFMGRVGAGPAVESRSIRRPLNDLMIRQPSSR